MAARGVSRAIRSRGDSYGLLAHGGCGPTMTSYGGNGMISPSESVALAARRDGSAPLAAGGCSSLRPCRDGNPAPAGGTGRAMVIRGGSNTLIAIGISRTPMDGGHGRAVLAYGGDCATTTRAGVDVEAVGVARPHWAKIRKMFGVDIAGIGGIRI